MIVLSIMEFYRQDKAEIGFEWCLKTAKTIVDKERTNERLV